MSFSLIITAGLISPIVSQLKVSSNLWKSTESFYIAEAGVEDVTYRVKNGIEYMDRDPLTIDNISAEVSVLETLDGMTITSVGVSGGSEKRVETKVVEGEGVSFSYGIQTGNGGFIMNGGTVEGNVYSNGEIVACGWCKITGTAISANGSTEFADQINDSPASPPNYLSFAKTTNTQDIAQSFKISTTTVVNTAEIYIKKIGSPSSAVLKLVKDSSGKPSQSSQDVLTTGTINSSSISTNPSWLTVPFTSNPTLNINTTYWLVIDASVNSTNYYSIGANLDNSYATGTSKIGNLSSSATWSNTGYDYYFKIYLGGVYGKISGKNQNNQFNVGVNGIGDAFAHTINYVEVAGNLKCKNGAGNNKSCDTNFSDPVRTPYPVSDANIDDWKAEALAGGVINGNYSLSGSSVASLGPKKVVGNLSITNSAKLTVTGTLWVTGNITFGGSAKMLLSPSFGNKSGVIVSDGRITIPDGTSASGSGISGSYIILVSNSTCDNTNCGGNYAINVSGTGGAVVLNAQKGTIYFNDGTANEITANKIIMNGGTITYQSGLINPAFTSGPSGSFNISSWREIE